MSEATDGAAELVTTDKQHTKELASIDRIREALEYEPDTGLLRWRIRVSRNIFAGSIAGANANDGYIQVRLDKRSYKAHRLAWAIIYGEHPKYAIDHINGDRADNRICNLREAPGSLNRENLKKAAGNGTRSGLLGVVWSHQRRRWRASIATKGKRYYLGDFLDKYEAHEAYVQAKRRLHPGGML